MESLSLQPSAVWLEAERRLWLEFFEVLEPVDWNAFIICEGLSDAQPQG